LAERTENLGAPHVHELVRLKETEAMLHAAQLILGASMFRTESRLSHFRDDFPDRDDEHWAVWVDATKAGSQPKLEKTPIPTPLCPIGSLRDRRPTRMHRGAIAGT
jgi:succinate dehydrogenase/fumarate reductase flavoprotein subunit